MWLMTILGCVLFETAEIDMSEKQTEELCESLGFERCDGIDNDCDGLLSPEELDHDQDGYVECTIEEEWLGAETIIGGDDCDDENELVYEPSTFYVDSDGDGFGDANNSEETCGLQDGFVEDSSDCDDSAANFYPGAPELCDGLNTSCAPELAAEEVDQDGDDFVSCEIDEGGWFGDPAVVGGDDCDDSTATVFPDAQEIPIDEFDQNCDGLELCYIDGDGDGFGSTQTGESEDLTCLATGFSVNNQDCDDSASLAFPGAAPEDSTTGCLIDVDGDGFGDSFPVNGSVIPGTDCNDANSAIYPTATEIYYDGIDQNCDEWSDFDADMDGQDSTEYSGLDCDDSDASIYSDANLSDPAADLVDQNCDGFETCYLDEDFDGFGNVSGVTGVSSTLDCSESGFSIDNSDCDDSSPEFYPGAPELCDGGDNDCDGSLSADEEDDDGDGFVECSIDANGWIGGSSITGGEDCDDGDTSIYPSAPEITSDGIDQDCDGADLEQITVAELVPGDLVITEVAYYNYQGRADDWFEVYNNSGSDVDLQGLDIFVNAGTFVVNASTILPVNSYIVFIESSDVGATGNFPFSQVDTIETGLLLSDLGDSISIEFNSLVINEIDIPNASSLGFGRGVSAVISDLAAPSNDISYWCPSQVLGYSSGNDTYVASPGMDNDDCDGDDDGTLYHVDCDDADPLLNHVDFDDDTVSTCDGDCDDSDPVLGVPADLDGDGETDCDGDCDDTNSTLNYLDLDGDGLTSCDGDCDDTNSFFNLDDVDGDGYTTCDGDCDDFYASFNLDDIDGDGATTCDGDCDDNNANFIVATDADYDGETDCEGDCDDNDQLMSHSDLDGDGLSSCDGDCDDLDPSIGATDADGDGVTACGGDCDDSDPALNLDDVDGDGWTSCGGDCDDSDPLVTGEDLDGDGYSACQGDFDDNDGSIYPGAFDIIDDGIDQDCDGVDATGLTASELVADDIIFTEYMAASYFGIATAQDEWIEIYNPTTETIDLMGLTLENEDAQPYEITEHINLEPGEYFVLGGSNDPELNGGIELDHEYGNLFTIDASGDFLVLFYDDGSSQIEIARHDIVQNNDYTDGVSSITYDVSDIPNNAPTHWCYSSVQAYQSPSGTELYYGTPGEPNDSCEEDGDGYYYDDCDDTDASLNLDDADGDGLTSCDGDCDDSDPAINLDDLDMDGLSTCDGDCDDTDGAVGVDDQDGDGFSACLNDCDDLDPNINPDTEEIMNDGIDQDCDGSDFIGLEAADLVEGDIIITEIQNYAWDTDEEWIEFYNTTGSTIDLFGLEIMNDQFNPYTISDHLYMEPGDYFLAGRESNPNQNGGLVLNIDYSGINLGNNNDMIVIYYDDGSVQTDIARIDYDNSDDWGNNRGHSKGVTDVSIIPNNDTSYWCESSAMYYNFGGIWNFLSLYGTPGEPNESCDSDGDGQFAEDCDDSDANTYLGAAELDDLFECMEDADGDGYGNMFASGAVEAGTDCDDTDPDLNQDDYDGDGLSTCDGDCNDYDPNINLDDLDGDGFSSCLNDCDDTDLFTYAGAAENDSLVDCMRDFDGDGYGEANPALGIVAGTDCSDSDPNRYPGNTEIEDGIDNDCDGIIDEGTNAYDDDGDGFTENDGDCRDSNANVYPGAAYIESPTHCMEDADGDGYGNDNPPQGVLAGLDCNDSNAGINPGATDIPNDGIDQNCDLVDATNIHIPTE